MNHIQASIEIAVTVHNGQIFEFSNVSNVFKKFQLFGLQHLFQSTIIFFITLFNPWMCECVFQYIFMNVIIT